MSLQMRRVPNWLGAEGGAMIHDRRWYSRILELNLGATSGNSNISVNMSDAILIFEDVY